jgi:hypothetical protein
MMKKIWSGIKEIGSLWILIGMVLGVWGFGFYRYNHQVHQQPVCHCECNHELR